MQHWVIDFPLIDNMPLCIINIGCEMSKKTQKIYHNHFIITCSMRVISLVTTPIKETNTCIYNGSNRADVHRPRRIGINWTIHCK